MPWVAPKTDFVNGDVLTATQMNNIGGDLAMLNGGTTGQVLAKASAADGDFAWTSETDPNAIPKTLIDAKGDLIAGSAADTAARLAVGTNGQVLTADSTTATGLKWGTASSGGASWALLNAGGTALTGATTVTVSGIASTVKGIMVLVTGASAANNGSTLSVRVNGITSSSYTSEGGVDNKDGTYSKITSFGGAQDKIPLGKPQTSTETLEGAVYIMDTNGTGLKAFTSVGASSAMTNASQNFWLGGVIDTSGAVISSVSVVSSSGNLDAGTVYVYGAS